MKPWVSRQLPRAGVRVQHGRRLLVVVDPEHAIEATDPDAAEVLGVIVAASDWFELRRAYEHQWRHTPDEDLQLAILVRDPTVKTRLDLPYDIDAAAATVVLDNPVPEDLRLLVDELTPHLADKAVSALAVQPADPLTSVVAACWDVSIPTSADPAAELAAVAKLRLAADVPASLWSALGPRVRSTLAAALAAEPPQPGPVEAAWRDWLENGDTSCWHQTMSTGGAELGPLFAAGILQPQPIRPSWNAPSWTAIGMRAESAADRAQSLFETGPPHVPEDVDGWLHWGQWWAELRAALAEGAPDTAALTQQAWRDLWTPADRAFGNWYRANAGLLLSRSAPFPTTVDKIAPFLERRIRTGQARRVVLVVLDGMSLSQWQIVRNHSALYVAASGVCFAMAPTLTNVSRQAIIAGALPYEFADSLGSTATEPKQWQSFWRHHGLAETDVRYHKINGATVRDVPELGTARAVAIVVTAVDEISHGADVLGDAQAAAALRSWAEHGFLVALVHQATEAGFEVWITADHGNVEAVGSGRIAEGLAVEHAGTRVRWYSAAPLRDAARADGISWDPPGLPDGACFPLFAADRSGFFSGAVRLAHGGISIDELLVPLAEVRP